MKASDKQVEGRDGDANLLMQGAGMVRVLG